MKKDRSKHILTKVDYEKFEYHDTRFFGLFYKKTDNEIRVKVDIKRLRHTVNCNFTDQQLKIINSRRTHYFYPPKSEYGDYCCNIFTAKFEEITEYWEENKVTI